MTPALRSTLDISFDVKAGLLVRQTHHWAALVFVAAIVVHMLRVFFTGAFRKPRELTYVIGVLMLILAIVEGFAGYSLPDDLLSGMGLAIANAVTNSVPVVGASLASLIWGGTVPTPVFESRLFIAHVLIFPVVIGTLLAVHLGLVARTHHTQFNGPRETERNVVGSPMWPRYALRSTGFLAAVAGALILLGGLVQINPVWIWGPYEPYLGSNGAQPDWYMGWLIGALRITPGFDLHIGSYTLVPNPFWGGVLFPGLVFSIVLLWPFIERRFTRDYAEHHLLDRPRERPFRTAFGVGLFLVVVTTFFAGAADRFFFSFGIPYETQVTVFRILLVLVPAAGFAITYSVCRELVALDRVKAREKDAP
jgi:ubiquinol-cytochrome c reductase cytochrome b subunit